MGVGTNGDMWLWYTCRHVGVVHIQPYGCGSHAIMWVCGTIVGIGVLVHVQTCGCGTYADIWVWYTCRHMGVGTNAGMWVWYTCRHV